MLFKCIRLSPKEYYITNFQIDLYEDKLITRSDIPYKWLFCMTYVFRNGIRRFDGNTIFMYIFCAINLFQIFVICLSP